MLRKKMPLYAVAAAWAAGTTCVLLVMGHGEAPRKIAVHHPQATGTHCPYILKRVQVSAHVRPMLSAEPECESSRYAEVKQAVVQAIDRAKIEGRVDAVSVYVRDFNKGEWFAIDGDRRYDPGSLIKLPVVLTMLRMTESDPALRTRSFGLMGAPNMPEQRHAPHEPLDPSGEYDLTVLLERSLEHSDNTASSILAQRMDYKLFRSLLRQLGLPEMPGNLDRYPLSPSEYGQFIKALHNSSYLSPRASQYLVDRLLHSDFKDGMRAGIPDEVEVAHDFGEAGGDGAFQLHDAGLVFAPNGTYLAVVMTQGHAVDALPGVVARVHEAIFQGMGATSAHPGGIRNPQPAA